MNEAKAKKAVEKSQDYQQAMQALAAEQGKQSAMQPPDGYINPLGRMGVVPTGAYSQYNMV